MTRRLPLALVALLALCFPRWAGAGGYEYPAQGSLALSRAGAFTARADDPSALVHNPAGLARLRGTHILLGGNVLMEDVHFQRMVYDEKAGAWSDRYLHDPNTRMPEITNHNDPFLTPLLGMVTDLGVLAPYNLVLVAGVYGPHTHPTRTYPRYCKKDVSPCEPLDDPALAGAIPSPARYDVGHVDVLVVYPSLGLAWQPVKGLSFGGVVQFTWASLKFSSVITAAGAVSEPKTAADRESPLMDINAKIEVQDSFTPTGILGVHYAPLSFLEAGASVRIGFPLNFEGDVSASADQPLLQGLLSGMLEQNPMPIAISLRMPWVVRAGLRYINRDARERERFDVELDFVYESTSQVDNLQVDINSKINLPTGSGPQPVAALDQTHNWNDSWSLRLGGTYQLHDLIPDGILRLSLGGYYESASVPDPYTRLDFLPFERYGLAAGLAAGWRWLSLTLGYMHLFHTSREVRDSKVLQMSPIDASYGSTIGNGNWSYEIDMVTIGLQAAF